MMMQAQEFLQNKKVEHAILFKYNDFFKYQI